MTMTRARAGLLLAAVFLLGMAGGALATCALGQRGFLGHGPFAFRSPDRIQQAIVRRLTWRLDLDDAQRKALEAAVARARADLDRIHGETFPRIEAVFERAFDEVAPALRPDQREKLETIRSRTRERLRRHRAPGPSE